MIQQTPAATAPDMRCLEPSDEELMRRCRSGDGAAMDRLVTRHYDRLFRFCYRTLYDREAAEDAVQQAFLRAYRHAGRFRSEGSFVPWLLAIAANLCRTELRQRPRRPRPVDEAPPLAVGACVEAEALRRLEGAEVYEALALLSPEHRLVVVLFYYEGLTYAEIARVCGCAVGTAKSRLHYALERLRRWLVPPGEPTGDTQAQNRGVS